MSFSFDDLSDDDFEEDFDIEVQPIQAIEVVEEGKDKPDNSTEDKDVELEEVIKEVEEDKKQDEKPLTDFRLGSNDPTYLIVTIVLIVFIFFVIVYLDVRKKT